MAARSLISDSCPPLSASKGFGSAWEQAYLTPRGHWEAGVTAGKTILNSTPGTEEMSVNKCYSSSTCVHLVSCQILNVEKNCLKALPDSIGDLRLLQTLNLKGMMLPASYIFPFFKMYKSHDIGYVFSPSLCICTGNCLSELPSSFGSLSSLRTLDLSDNNIVQLPKALAYIRTLEVCVLGFKLTGKLGHDFIKNLCVYVCCDRALHLMRRWCPTHLRLCVQRGRRASNASCALVRVYFVIPTAYTRFWLQRRFRDMYPHADIAKKLLKHFRSHGVALEHFFCVGHCWAESQNADVTDVKYWSFII